MLLLGAHTSIAGGYHKAVVRGSKLGLGTMQIFTKNQLRWCSKPIKKQDIELYKKALSEHRGIKPVFAHGSYLYNFASPGRQLVEQSIHFIQDELDRCTGLNLPFLIIHPGSHMDSGEADGIKRVITSLETVLTGDAGRTVICIETTAGQGTCLGFRFEHLKDIINGTGVKRIGACLDTCHIFAAGYDIRTYSSYQSTIELFDKIVGLSHLKVIHLNDSKESLGSGIDRHAHIGMGMIGMKCFQYFMRDERFKTIPKVIETPKKLDGKEMDRVNLDILRKCAADTG